MLNPFSNLLEQNEIYKNRFLSRQLKIDLIRCNLVMLYVMHFCIIFIIIATFFLHDYQIELIRVFCFPFMHLIFVCYFACNALYANLILVN